VFGFLEYTEALRQGTTVTLLISEVTGARHSLGERFLRSCAAAYAERHPTAAGPSADRSFYSLHSSFLSTASLRGLGRQLRTKVLSSVSVSSLRRRAPTCSSSPPRAGGPLVLLGSGALRPRLATCPRIGFLALVSPFFPRSF